MDNNIDYIYRTKVIFGSFFRRRNFIFFLLLSPSYQIMSDTETGELTEEEVDEELDEMDIDTEEDSIDEELDELEIEIEENDQDQTSENYSDD